MTLDEQIARLIVEGELAKVASVSLPLLREHALAAGCAPRYVAAFMAMSTALHENLTESEIEALKADIERDVRTGLAALYDERTGG